MLKIIKRTIVYESKWLTLYEELLDCGNNRRELYNKVLTFDTAHVVPIFDDGSLLMVENYRHAVGQQLLELPGGFINPGETPMQAAGESSWKKQDTPLMYLRRCHFITLGQADARKKTMSFVPKACTSIPARHSTP